MPVLQSADSGITWALTQASNNIIAATSTVAPTSTHTMAALEGSLALTFLAIAILGVVQDFENGMKMKYKALLFNIGAIVGLYVFWKPISNLYPAAIGSNAIYSSILSIIVISIGIGIAIYLERRTYRF